MKILGVCHDRVSCSAAVVVDGRVVSAIAEERLDRRKQSRVFPTLAIPRCLELAGLRLDEVDEVAIGWNPSIDLETMPAGFLDARRWRTEYLAQVPARLGRLCASEPAEAMTLTGAARGCPPITFINHYDAHVGDALSVCSADEVAVLVMDGRAETQTTLLGVMRGVEFETLAEVKFPHSLGLFYGAITEFLGFKPNRDEWKVMALAASGEQDGRAYARLRNLVRVAADGTYELALDHFEFFNFFDRRMYSDKFVREFGDPRRPGDPLLPAHRDLAAAAQRVFEETVGAVATALHTRSGVDRVAMSGGCFMNSVLNGKLHRLAPFSESFVSSCPDDAGTAVGAALFLHAKRTGARGELARHNAWGPAYTDDECREVAERYRLPGAQVVEDVAARAAEDLAAGSVVGWFQGAMEFGQRALGNRSILLDPRRPDGRALMNSTIKFREDFRPFAPAVLAEHVADYFECEEGTRVPFMERVLPVRAERRDEIPAVVHVDGSGRVQTVERQPWSARFRALLEAFHARTGVPLLLNTSFNVNGEPIVCSPDDAIRTFYTSGMDVLYLGNVRLSKSGARRDR